MTRAEKAERLKRENIAALPAWLEKQAELADKSSTEWIKGNEQSAYRAGEWFAYRNVLNFLTGANYL